MGKEIKKKHWKTIVKELKEMHAEAVLFQEPLNRAALANYRRFQVIEDLATMTEQGHKYKGRSKVVDPEPNRVIESIVPRIAKGATIKYAGRNGLGLKNVFALNTVTEYELDVMMFELKSKMWVKEGLITGISFGHLGWRKENSRGARKRISLDKTVKDKKPLYDLPWFTPIDFFKVSWNPRATTYENMGYIFIDFDETKSTLLENESYDEKKIKKLTPAADVNRGSDYARMRLQDKKLNQNDGPEGLIRGFEFYGKYDIDGDGRYEMCHIVVGGVDAENSQALILKSEINEFDHAQNPILPYRPLPNPHEFGGMSVLDAPAGMFAALTALMRQTLDAGTLALNPIVKYVKGGGVDVKRLISKPGAIWPMRDLAAVDVVSLPDPSAWSSNMMDTLRLNIQNTTGATDFISGGSSVSSRTTATEFVGKIEQANAKFQSMLEMFEKESLHYFGDQLKSLNQQFFDEERTIFLTGGKGEKLPVTVGVEDLFGDFTTITETSASKVGDQRVRANTTLQAWQMFAQDPFVNPVWLRTKVIEDVFDWKDAKENVRDPNEAAQAALAKETQRMHKENQDPFMARIQPGDDDNAHIKIHDLVLTNLKVAQELETEVGPGSTASLMAHRQEHVDQYWIKQGVLDTPTSTPPASSQEEVNEQDEQKEQENALPEGTPGRPPMKPTETDTVEAGVEKEAQDFNNQQP